MWDKGYIGNVVITNTSDITIENWEISYESADEYSNIWNAEITYHSARIYHIKNAGHNQNIKPNESVSFGFQASYHNNIDIPITYKLLGEEMEVTDSDGNVSYNVRDKWGTGCIIDVTIHNTSNQPIEDWSLQFDYSCKIDNIWRAKIDKIEGNTYYVKNCEYNSVIAAGTDETFGMQVSYTKGQQPEKIENIVLNEKKKQVNYIEFDKEWNRIMTRADANEVAKAIQNHPYVVNVALIDSGIDYMNGINVVESENFVEECEESNPIFEDLLGHGTAVAGLMAYNQTGQEQENGEIRNSITNETIAGMNPYINLYSAIVLDEDNKTTIDRLIRGIEWAIEKDVNIININCGVSKDSKELHKVIKKAYNKGMLIIAAAGNGKSVQYPAKYSEVMAVGSIKCNGEKATDSASGEELEVVAPGQDVTSVGPFGMLYCFSGTSMASPQVVALASILWQQDMSKSNEFIRQLIDISANPLGDKESFGYGLIDCKCALEKYKEFEQCFSEKKTIEENVDINLDYEIIEANSNELICVTEESVKGYWSGKDHEKTVDNTIALKKGAKWPDNKLSKVKGMGNFQEFHGYFGSEKAKVNYIDAYLFMTEVASNMYHKSTKKNVDMDKEVWMIPEKRVLYIMSLQLISRQQLKLVLKNTIIQKRFKSRILSVAWHYIPWQTFLHTVHMESALIRRIEQNSKKVILQ